jgi:hypothetical protein
MGVCFRLLDSAVRHALPLSALSLLFLAVEAVSATHRGRDRTVLDSLYGGAAVATAYAGVPLLLLSSPVVAGSKRGMPC